jgi:type III pantothenate kinase
VGADLICAAAGLKDSSRPALIIDLGTATKYIYVHNKSILGVIITPGVRISIKALVGNTALLHDIDIETPKKVLGTTTTTCMQSGVTYGVAAQVDGLIDRIRDEVKADFDVILTGGLSKLIAPLCRRKVSLNDTIVLDGILQIYLRNK